MFRLFQDMPENQSLDNVPETEVILIREEDAPPPSDVRSEPSLDPKRCSVKVKSCIFTPL
eukprot:2336934-Prymnesium_polylepis.1